MKIFLFFALIYAITKTSFAIEGNITPIKTETLNELRKYKFSSDECKNIEKNLVEIRIKYFGFDGKIKQDGLIIAHKAVAKNVENIFKELFEIKFPIAGINPFKGGNLTENGFMQNDDYNYTYSFGCRKIQGGSSLSVHSFGMAIDLNPLQNPFIQILQKEKSIEKIIPKDGVFYLNRERQKDGMVTKKVVEIFTQNGFNIWGGSWENPIDYQHFQVSKPLAILIASMKPEHGERLFQLHTQFYNQHKKEIIRELGTNNIESLMQEYRENPLLFLKKIEKLS